MAVVVVVGAGGPRVVVVVGDGDEPVPALLFDPDVVVVVGDGVTDVVVPEVPDVPEVPLCDGGAEIVFFLGELLLPFREPPTPLLATLVAPLLVPLTVGVAEFVTTGFEDIRDLIALPSNRLVVVDDGTGAGVAW